MTSTPKDAGAFELGGDNVGFLLLHGFSGAPLEMRPLGDWLAAKGRTVLAPRLPGHATTPDNLGQVAYAEWIETARDGFDQLSSRCDEVIVCGLSMGALLGAHVCASKPATGLVAMAPALKTRSPPLILAGLLKPFIKTVSMSKRRGAAEPRPGTAPSFSYDHVPTSAVHELHKLIKATELALKSVTCRLLVMHAQDDHSVNEAGARRYLALAESGDKELVFLPGCGHNIPTDPQREVAFAHIDRFLAAAHR